jgi:hypothetical protein
MKEAGRERCVFATRRTAAISGVSGAGQKRENGRLLKVPNLQSEKNKLAPEESNGYTLYAAGMPKSKFWVICDIAVKARQPA